MTFELPAHFWAKVRIDTPTGCWLWTGASAGNGYGRFKSGKSLVLPHRLSYEAHVGPIAAGMVLDHLCHNPEICSGGDTCAHRSCVNPDHLEPVGRSENSARSMHVLTTQNSAKTHCIHGHPFSAANTYVNPRGHRDCRICRAESNRRRLPRVRVAS